MAHWLLLQLRPALPKSGRVCCRERRTHLCKYLARTGNESWGMNVLSHSRLRCLRSRSTTPACLTQLVRPPLVPVPRGEADGKAMRVSSLKPESKAPSLRSRGDKKVLEHSMDQDTSAVQHLGGGINHDEGLYDARLLSFGV